MSVKKETLSIITLLTLNILLHFRKDKDNLEKNQLEAKDGITGQEENIKSE